MKQIDRFLKGLKKNNNREWFALHKEEYLAVKEKIEQLTSALVSALSSIEPDAASLRPSDCTYRIYRDTRFSSDKTPYKTHIGIFINPPEGKKSLRCGYYLHLEPGEYMFAAGTVCLPGPIVKAIRQSIFDNIEEYRNIVEDPEFRSIYTELGMNPVKTAPKGFPKDWPYIRYIRPRDFMAAHNIPATDILQYDLSTAEGIESLAEALLPAMRQAKRFNDFINYTIDDCTDDSDSEVIPHIY